MEDRTDQIFKTSLLMLAAGVTGAALALLFAPQSGRRTRRDLKRAGRGVAQKCDEFQEDLGIWLEELSGDSRKLGQKGVDRGREMTRKAQQEVLGALENGKELISRQIEKVEAFF